MRVINDKHNSDNNANNDTTTTTTNTNNHSNDNHKHNNDNHNNTNNIALLSFLGQPVRPAELQPARRLLPGGSAAARE